MEPLPSSPRSPLRFLVRARVASSSCRGRRTSSRTRDAKSGLRGQPWAKPSVWRNAFHWPLWSRYQHLLSALYRRSKKGSRRGKCCWREDRQVSREHALNMLTMSSAMSTRVRCTGLDETWRETRSCVRWAITSMPPDIPTPSCPAGRRWAAKA